MEAAAAHEQSRATLWQDLRAAVAGNHHDFTSGSIDRAILLLAVPMVLEMVLESLFALVDVIWVARLGTEAAAAVGITEGLITLMFAIAMGLSMATTAVVARRVGEKNTDAAAHAAVQSIILGFAISAVIGVIGILFGPELLHLMGGSKELVEAGSAYTRILLGGSMTIFLLFLINAIFRGAGDAVIAMRVLWFGNIINLILDPLFIFGIGPFPELGVAGAATATTIGRGCAVLLQFRQLTKKGARVTIRRKHISFDWPLMKHIFNIASGGMLQYLIGTASWVGLWRLTATFGSSALAGYTIALRIIFFTILPAWGLSNAAATLVGQNLGAKQPKRAEISVWRTGLYNMSFLTLLATAFWLVPHQIVGLITHDPEVSRYAVMCLQYLAVGYPCYAWGMVMVQALNGAGDTRTPMIINLFCYWMFQIPFAYFMALWAGFETRGVYIAIAATETLMAASAMLVFRHGSWKTRDV